MSDQERNKNVWDVLSEWGLGIFLVAILIVNAVEHIWKCK